MLDVKVLMEIMQSFAAIIPMLIVGLTQVIKGFIPEQYTSKAAPGLSVLLGIASAFLIIGFTRQSFVIGIVFGLTASGLWSGGKTFLEKAGNAGNARLPVLMLLAVLMSALLLVSCAGTAKVAETNKAISEQALYQARVLMNTKVITPEQFAEVRDVYDKASDAQNAMIDARLAYLQTKTASAESKYQVALEKLNGLVAQWSSLVMKYGLEGAR